MKLGISPKSRWTCRKRGFSLIEVMITVALVSVMFFATLSLIMTARMLDNLEQERARAHEIVTGELDRVRFALFSRVTGGDTVTIWDNGTPADDTDDTEGTLSVTIRDQAGNTLDVTPVPSQIVEIEVTLSWTPRGRIGNRTYRETVMAYITP